MFNLLTHHFPFNIESAQEELTMATSADFPPFEFLAPDENGVNQIVGFDIDLANAIAEELDFELTIENRSFPTLIDSLANDEFDFVIAALNATPERREKVDFSDPYYQETIALLSNNNNPIDEIEDLANGILGVQTNSSGVNVAQELQQTVEGLEFTSFDEQSELVSAVESNEIDAAITVDVVAEFLVEDNPTLGFITIPDLGGFDARIAFPPGSPKIQSFNTTLADLQEEGIIERLEEKWFVGNPSQPGEVEPLLGTEQDDILKLITTNQLVLGDEGNDIIDTFISKGNNQLEGGEGDDQLIASRGDFLLGGEGDDLLNAATGNGNNDLFGGEGNDVLIGGQFDHLVGGEGDDDLLVVEKSSDNLLTGGEGKDSFWISYANFPEGATRITDFQVGEDILGFSGLELGFEDIALSQSRDGKDAVINVFDQSIAILSSVDFNHLTANDFVFEA